MLSISEHWGWTHRYSLVLSFPFLVNKSSGQTWLAFHCEISQTISPWPKAERCSPCFTTAQQPILQLCNWEKNILIKNMLSAKCLTSASELQTRHMTGFYWKGAVCWTGLSASWVKMSITVTEYKQLLALSPWRQRRSYIKGQLRVFPSCQLPS